MTERLLLPVRVPELGPALGRLPDRPDPARPDPLDAVRLRLVTRVLEAAGEARRRAAAGERQGALAALAGSVWLDAWEEAVAAVAELVLDDVTERLEAAARRARMGRRRRRRLAPTDTERRGVAARFGATGAGLVGALDSLERVAAEAAVATARERDVMERWRETLLAAAHRMEGAWETLRAAADAERDGWEAEIGRTEAWRPAWWPVLLAGGIVLGAAAWVGAVLGGYLAAPGWFTRLWEALVR